MSYTTISVRKDNTTKKYMLSYADYLEEAWLSEISEGEKAKIVKQFKCKSTSDLAAIVANIAKLGGSSNCESTKDIRKQVASLQIKVRPSWHCKVFRMLGRIFPLEMLVPIKYLFRYNIPSSAKLI